MGNDIRRGQYDAYCERKDILKRLPRLPDEAAVSDPLPFEAWTAKDQFPWTQLEDHLRDTAGPSFTCAPDIYDSNEESAEETGTPVVSADDSGEDEDEDSDEE